MKGKRYLDNLDYKFKWRVMLRLKTTHRHIRGTLTTGALLFEICDQRKEKISRIPPFPPMLIGTVPVPFDFVQISGTVHI